MSTETEQKVSEYKIWPAPVILSHRSFYVETEDAFIICTVMTKEEADIARASIEAQGDAPLGACHG